ncbi:MAG: DUF6335 family protein [Patescibacteria group bacterium]
MTNNNNKGKLARDIFGEEVVSYDETLSERENEIVSPYDQLNPDEDYTSEADSGYKHSKKVADLLTDSEPGLSSNDLDANWESSQNTGEEDSAGSVETPDQDQIDSISEPWGTSYQDEEALDVNKKENMLEHKKEEDDIEGLKSK